MVLAKLKRYLKSQIGFSKRLEKETAEQRKAGYRITLKWEGPEQVITYREGKRQLIVFARFNWANDVVLELDSIKRWDYPGGRLTEPEYQKVLERVIKFLSVWGNVSLDATSVRY